MRLLLFIAALLFIASCSVPNEGNINSDTASNNDESSKDLIASNADTNIDDFLTELSTTEEQSFRFDPSSDTVIYGTEGTKIIFPENIFVHKDGSKVKGMVDVKIKECYQLADFISEKLQTSAGEDLLETAGMVHLSATCDGEEVFIEEGKSYEVHIPKGEQNKPGMTAFYGNELENGVMDWTLAPGITSRSTPSSFVGGAFTSGASEIAPTPMGVVYNKPEPKLKGKHTTTMWIEAFERKGIIVPEGKTMTTWKLEGRDQTLFEYFNENFEPDMKMKDVFVKTQYKPIYGLNYDSTGTLSSVEIFRGSTEEYDQRIANFIGTIPKLDQKEFQDTSIFHFHHVLIKPRFEVEFESVEDMAAKGVSYDDFLDTKVEVGSKDDLDYYVLEVAQLGWINCDSFRDGDGERINLYVDVPDPENTKLQMTFKDFESCMHAEYTPGGLVFKNVPSNMDVKLIAIHYEGGQPAMSVQETKIEVGRTYMGNFTSFTYRDLIKELNAI